LEVSVNSEEILKEVTQQAAECTRCRLHHSRKKSVPGAGTPHTSIMFIGEGPGFNENEQGLPFVGQAGKLLDELLAEADLSRDEVFITNVVKCRPPKNRDPQVDELEACRPYLDRQIAAVNPDVIVTLGRISMSYFVNKGKISSIHGRSFWSNGRMAVPMYHPAAALHQPSLRSVIKEDFAKLPAYIKQAQESRQNMPGLNTKTEEDPVDSYSGEDHTTQLSLF
jgi:uracil-DNA glycosylase